MKPSGMLLATAQVPPFRQGIWGHTSTKVSQWRPQSRKWKGVLEGRRSNCMLQNRTLLGCEPVKGLEEGEVWELISKPKGTKEDEEGTHWISTCVAHHWLRAVPSSVLSTVISTNGTHTRLNRLTKQESTHKTRLTKQEFLQKQWLIPPKKKKRKMTSKLFLKAL